MDVSPTASPATVADTASDRTVSQHLPGSAMTASPVSLSTRPSFGPPWEAPRPLPPVSVAITGPGRTGLAQAAVLSAIPGCTLAAVVDPRPGARGQLRGCGRGAGGCGSLEKLGGAARPQAVFITGP